jgi:hypothetical protein
MVACAPLTLVPAIASADASGERPDALPTVGRAAVDACPRCPDAPEGDGWRVGRTPDVFRGDGPATRVGGWIDASYQDNDVDSESINVNHLNFFFDTRVGRTWQAFVEVEFENEPGVRGFEDEREYEVEQAYGRFAASDAATLRLGKFNTPFGYWTPLHWSILMDTITEPIHEGTRVTPEQQVGVELAGRWVLAGDRLSESEVSYALYAGYGDDVELFEASETDGVSFGGDLRLRLQETNLFGVSLYQQTRELEDPVDERRERSIMLYGEWHPDLLPLHPLTLRFEVFRSLRSGDLPPGVSRRINIGYVKARWDLTPRLYLNYRYNYGDDEGEGLSDERHTHTVTLGFRPTPSLRVKLEYAGNEFRASTRRDFHYWGLSVGALF